MTSSLFSGSVDVEHVGSSVGLCFLLATVIHSEGEGVGWLYNRLKLSLLGTATSYASLIENVINLPSEVASLMVVSEIPSNIKTEWQWCFFEAVAYRKYVNRTSRVYHFLNKVENEWNRTLKESYVGIQTNDAFCIVYGKKRKASRQQ
ncbi:hypothetical protein Tco_1071701 [Tanacetum coccineum]